jgi:hypothetical protein
MMALASTGQALALRFTVMNLPIDLDAYFERIRWGGATHPAYETLAGLLRAHMRHIPFENLDVLLGKGIELDLDVLQRRCAIRRASCWLRRAPRCRARTCSSRFRFPRARSSSIRASAALPRMCRLHCTMQRKSLRPVSPAGWCAMARIG